MVTGKTGKHSATAINTDHSTGSSHINLEPSTSAREKEERQGTGGKCESMETHKIPPVRKQRFTEKTRNQRTKDKRKRAYVDLEVQTREANIGQNT